jgi:peptidyl-prolyl cis-trans isomerase D
MLQAFRGIVGSVAGKLLFGLLVGTFALLGVGYGIRDLVLGRGTSNDAADVAGTKITVPELDRSFRRALSNASRELGPGFTPSPAQRQEVARQALDEQVTDALFAKAAAEAGLRVDDAVVRARTEEMPAFAGPDKKFDRGRFRMIIENQGMSEAAFAQLMRRDIARSLLASPIAAGAIAPKALVADLYRYRNEQRVAETILLPDSAATGIPTPTDADLQSYYQRHAVDFTLPEYRSFTVLTLAPDLFAGEITPTDDELRAAYDQRKAEFVDPEKRRIEQVVIPDKAAADAIVKAAQGGKSLADAAKAATAGKSQPVALDLLARDDYPEPLRDPVFSAKPNAVVGPIQSPLGWHVLSVAEIKPGHEVTFDEARPKLTADVKRERAADMLSEQIDGLGDRLLGGASMEQVGAGVNATPVKFASTDAKGGTPPAAQDVKRTAPDPAALAKAFQLQPGETSGFEAGKDGGYFAVRLDGVTPPALRPLAEIRADVVAGWIAEQRASVIAKRADALAAQVRQGTAMSQIAATAGAKVETAPPLKREPDPSQTGEDRSALAAALFGLGRVGDVAVVPAPDGQIIARLSEIRAADPAAAGDALQPLAREIAGDLRDDEIKAYQAALRSQYKVTINPQAIERVAGP